MIAVVDYGAGNLGSVRKALELAFERASGAPSPPVAPPEGRSAQIAITSDPAVVDAAEAVVLPGVGAFGEGMARLRAAGLEEPLRRAFSDGRPFLGICLGQQLLLEESEESPGVRGLACVEGRVRRFPTGMTVPHMGWNQLEFVRRPAAFEGVAEGAYVYFVHSYFVDPADESLVATRTEYGDRFCSTIAVGNAIACQFHPEKSQDVGLRILENWARSVSPC